MRNLQLFLTPLLLLLLTESQAQPELSTPIPGVLTENQVNYTLIHYRETDRSVSIRITYPNGRVHQTSRSYKRSEGHRIGDYSWLMGYLQTLLEEGYRIKSHSMVVPNDESHMLEHFYLLEQVREDR